MLHYLYYKNDRDVYKNEKRRKVNQDLFCNSLGLLQSSPSVILEVACKECLGISLNASINCIEIEFKRDFNSFCQKKKLIVLTFHCHLSLGLKYYIFQGGREGERDIKCKYLSYSLSCIFSLLLEWVPDLHLLNRYVPEMWQLYVARLPFH